MQMKTITLCHPNQDVIHEWARALKQQSDSIKFESKYLIGEKIGSG